MDKITEEDKNAQINTIAQKIEDLQEELVEADQYVKEKEQIVDDAMSFIRTPDIFWNRANTKIRQDIQLLLFPNGIAYDFETGFGTADKLESYLLIEKMADKTANNSDLVTSRGRQHFVTCSKPASARAPYERTPGFNSVCSAN